MSRRVARIVYGRQNRYFVDDTEVSKEQFDATFPTKIEDVLASGILENSNTPSCWPMKSIGAAIHPTQIPEVMERDKARGVPTEYTRAGEPVFTDRGHRKAYLKSHGHFDRDGGYGD